MKPWVGYIRVSHVGGREGDSFHSPDDQRAAIEAQAADLGAEVVILTPDLNEKGHDPERETLVEAIEGVEAGRYQGVLVAYLSRLSRRTRLTLELWDRVKAAGGRVIAVKEGIDSAVDTANSNLQLQILSAIDEHQHRTASENFELRRQQATAAGIWQRRQVPTGYVKDDRRRLAPGPDADKVRQAFRDRAARRPLSEIADDLGLTTSGVRKLLENRVYLGELRVGQHVNPEAHPPLVTEDEWLAAQTAPAPRKRRALRETFLLTGLVRCASCGHAMAPSRTKKQDAYSCHGRSSAGRCPAPSAISRQRLDAYVEPIALAEFAKLRVSVEEDTGRVDTLRAQVRRAREEMDAYLGAVSAADVGAEAFAQGAKLRRDEVAAAEGALSTALGAAPAAPQADVLAVWDDLPLELRTRALSTLIEAVLVAPTGAGRVVPVGDRVRVIAYGSGIAPGYGGGGRAMGIRTVDFADLDHKAVLGV